MATDSRSRGVQGRVVRTSIVVAPGGPTIRASAALTARPNAVASTPQGTPDMAMSPGSASPQPMDCDDNHAGPDDALGLHSTQFPGIQRVAEKCAQQGVWRDTAPSTARGGHVFAARAGHERDDTGGDGRHRAGDLNATEALVVAFIVNSGMTHANAGHLLRLLRNPAFEPDLVRFTSWNHWAEHLKRVCLHGINVLDLATPSLDGACNTDTRRDHA